MSDQQFEEGPIFPNLPEAMVDEVLQKSEGVAEDFLVPLEELNVKRKDFRKGLESKRMLEDVSSKLAKDKDFTTCASDGTYVVESLMASDLTVAAAVCVEGLVPPKEQGHWPGPRHEVYLDVEAHHDKTSSVLRAVMVGEELKLLAAAPHDLAMFDGTLFLPVIYFNQAMSAAKETEGSLKCSRKFQESCLDYLASYLKVLQSSGRVYIGMPKYSSAREIGEKMKWPENIDDRALLSMLLKEGEMTAVQSMESSGYHLGTTHLPREFSDSADWIKQEILEELHKVHLFYFKPRKELPALRIELPGNAANDNGVEVVLHGLHKQMQAPAMLEPFPLYMADRYAKNLAKSMPAVRQVITYAMSSGYTGNITDLLFATNPYRSEDKR